MKIEESLVCLLVFLTVGQTAAATATNSILDEERHLKKSSKSSGRSSSSSSSLSLSSTSFVRRECPSPTNTFETFLAVAIEEDEDDVDLEDAVAHQLIDAHRQGTAAVCDEHQRALTEATLKNQAEEEDDDLTLALYRVQVQSKGNINTMNQCATAPPYSDHRLLGSRSSSSSSQEYCSIHDILDNTDQDNDNDDSTCPRFGCYCPAKDSEPSDGLTEAQLLSLLQHPPTSGKGKGKGKGGGSSKTSKSDRRRERHLQYQHSSPQLHNYQQQQQRFLGKNSKSSTKSTKSSATFVDVKELTRVACPGRKVNRGEYFFGLSQNFCDALTQQQAKEFSARFTHAYNVFSFNHCDPLFRRFSELTPPVCEDIGTDENGRKLFYSSTSWAALQLGLGDFSSPEQPGVGWYRRRHLEATDNISNKLSIEAETAQPRQTNPELVQSMRQLIDESEGYRQNNIDYGSLNQGDECYCDHHFTGTPRGITEPELNELARQIMLDVTGGNLEVLNSAATEAQTCGSPAVFTQTLNVITNGDEASVRDLAELLGRVLNRLSLTRCVANYFQVLDVNLVYQAEEVSTKTHPPKTAWALQFEVQYVAFGASGKDADLFWSECPLKKHMPSAGKRQLASPSSTTNYQFSSVLDPAGPSHWLGNLDRDNFQETVAQLQSAENAGRALFPIDKRKLESTLVATTCICDVNREHPLDQLPLSLVNHELDRVICDDALPGVTFALIVC